MKVSVIIPNYNYAAFVEEAIKSVFEQTYTNIECIVVNDGSTDNSLEVLDKLKTDKYSDLIIIDKTNGGLSSARNTGLKIATGDYISFLDADDFWMPRKIENQIKTFEETSVDIVFSNYTFFENNIFKKNNEKIIAEPSISDFIAKNPILGSSSSIILRKDVCNKIGFFDNNLRSLEDLDYWFRCRLENYLFKYSGAEDVCIRKHVSGNMSKNYMRMLSYHLIVFENQINSIKNKVNFAEKDQLKLAIIDRLSLIRWYALQLGKFEYSLLTIFLGIRLVGIKYILSPFIFFRMIKDFTSIIFKKI